MRQFIITMPDVKGCIPELCGIGICPDWNDCILQPMLNTVEVRLLTPKENDNVCFLGKNGKELGMWVEVIK